MTIVKTPNNNEMVCFQITHNQTTYSLHVISASKIVFKVSKQSLLMQSPLIYEL